MACGPVAHSLDSCHSPSFLGTVEGGIPPRETR